MSAAFNQKTILITGGTGGIGKETARGLAKLGAHLIITGRDTGRAQAAVAELKQDTGNTRIESLTADLSRQDDMHRLAETIQSRYSALHVLINNVGLLEGQRRLTQDGIEAHFAVNVVTPFLLTHLLLPLLHKSTPARVINLTGGMPGSTIDLANLQAEKSFSGLMTYSRAKQAMLAMSYEFAERTSGSGVSINVAYPGDAATAMTGAMTPNMLPFVMRLAWPVFKTMMREDNGKSAAKAARSSIYLASSAEVEGVTRAYFNTNGKQVGWPAAVTNEHNRRVIWELCERLAGQPELEAV
jgi:NAD(P)-dependent dehydrogenase (short-subunit alcohol dehydrogenase family)